METKQSNVLSMGIASRDFLVANATVINTVPQIAPLLTVLNSTISQAILLIEVQTVNNKGYSVAKNQLKGTLRNMSHEMSCKLAAYAHSANNMVLFNEVHITESRFKYATDVELKEYGQLIYDRANANATALAAFGVNAQTITALQTALTNYNVALPKFRLNVSEKKTATKQLDQQLTLMADTLKKIDVFVDVFRYSNTTLWSNYHNARKIVDAGKRSLALKGMVIDSVTKTAIKGVKLTFKSTDVKGGSDIVKRTADKGGIMLKTLPSGKYRLIADASGYQTKEMEIYVNDTEMYNLEIALTKIA